MPVDNEINRNTDNHTAEEFERSFALKRNFYGYTQLISSLKLLYGYIQNTKVFE